MSSVSRAIYSRHVQPRPLASATVSVRLRAAMPHRFSMPASHCFQPSCFAFYICFHVRACRPQRAFLFFHALRCFYSLHDLCLLVNVNGHWLHAFKSYARAFSVQKCRKHSHCHTASEVVYVCFLTLIIYRQPCHACFLCLPCFQPRPFLLF